MFWNLPLGNYDGITLGCMRNGLDLLKFNYTNNETVGNCSSPSVLSGFLVKIIIYIFIDDLDYIIGQTDFLVGKFCYKFYKIILMIVRKIRYGCVAFLDFFN